MVQVLSMYKYIADWQKELNRKKEKEKKRNLLTFKREYLACQK